MALLISGTKHRDRDWVASDRRAGNPAYQNGANANAPAFVLREMAVTLAVVLTAVAAVDVALTAFGIR